MFPLSQLGTTKTVEKAYKQRNGDIGEIVLKLQRIPDDDVRHDTYQLDPHRFDF